MSLRQFQAFKQLWKSATNLGNIYHFGCQYDAIKPYQDALFYSEVMFRHHADAQHFNFCVASPFFVANLNLSINYRTLGDLTKAGDHLFFAVWKLKMLSRIDGLKHSQFTEVQENWKKAVHALIQFQLKTRGKPEFDFWCEETYDRIASAKEMLNRTKQTRLN